MKSIIFNQHQVNHALKNEEGMFRVVVNNKQSFIEPSQPYGKLPFKVGETVFVKEAFGFEANGYGEFMVYKSDNPEAIYSITTLGKEVPIKWKPAQHMKQEHSRLILRIKSVKVERLQDISGEDAIKEGFLTDPNYSPFLYFEKLKKKTAEQKFISHWNSNHKKPEEKWGANPWVWCYEYEVVR